MNAKRTSRGGTSAQVPQPVGRGVLAMRVAAVFLVGAAVYLGALWLQFDAILREGGRLEDKVNASVTDLASEISAFRGDPDSAAALKPDLATARSTIKDIRAQTREIGSFVLPPFGSAGATYRSHLRSYTSRVDGYYATLSDLCTFVVDRGTVVERLSAGLQVLGTLSKPGTSTSDVRRVIVEARTAVDTSVEQLRSLSASGTTEASVYSNDALLARLTTLSGLLTNIVDGIDRKDAELLKAGTQNFSKLMQADWQVLFFTADDDGIVRFGEALAGLSTERQEISAARQDLAERRAATGAAALALAVVAFLTAAVAWLR